ncbi:helix-turn-helix transcriptional regulator [Pseudomaricurvus alkylphenolicus]|uniref:helix-turn-helix transcriptional regulator n=1 Tax=Pseudomaricurvus alkylphenolicus TaxID=1306991 RepID=UPI00141FF7F9|nr:AraC family transcriptional regulator [Pseudomaricurvus alkylphenolicus]NIB44916.1 helix-turn-helix transcriptional regulator [Pseudomaricurvus alkylphenolicus]
MANTEDKVSPFNAGLDPSPPLLPDESRPPELPLNFIDDLALKVRQAQARPQGEAPGWVWRQSCDGAGVRFDFRPEFGEGFSEVVDLGSGVFLRLRKSIHPAPFAVWSRHEGDVIFTLALSGGLRMATYGQGGGWVWAPAAMCGFSPSRIMMYSEVAAGVDIHLVSLLFRDVKALSSFGLPPSRVSTEFFSQLSKNSNAQMFCEPTADALRAGKEIIDCKFQGALRKLFFSGKTRELVCHIISSRVVADSVGQFSCETTLDSRTIAQLVHARIDMDLSRPVSGEELSRDIGVSRNRLMKCFKAEYGLTIGQYSQQVRMAYAEKLLTQTSLPITEISFNIGYDKPGSFTDAFRQHFGISPSMCRQSAGHGFAGDTAEEPEK